jgi:hypothetical protein
MSKSKGEGRGPLFVLTLIVVSVGLIVSIAIAGDDELRASVKGRLKRGQ